MDITIQLFGITREIAGNAQIVLSVAEGTTVSQLLQHLQERYPRLAGLSSLAVALNTEYATGIETLTQSDEIALIPPVSGG
jgi:molybdopterin synthase sulfur carrier subunit